MHSTQLRLFALAIAAMLGSIPVATQSFAQQQSSPPGVSKTDWTTLTNERINIVKGALQLTPEQQKYWPAVEEAIRARAQMREQRLNDTEERLDHQPLSIDPIAFLHMRADALTQRGASLKKLADAWQPLYQSLNPDQRQRMRVLVVDVLRDLREAVQARRTETVGRGR
jgi:hypothetical protein